jgi:hypothetical protein
MQRAGRLVNMSHSTDPIPADFRALYPDVADSDIAAVYDAIRCYAQLALDIASSRARADLTLTEAGGTVSLGPEVEPQHITTSYH